LHARYRREETKVIKEAIIERLKADVGIFRGEALFLCSPEKKDEIIFYARHRLMDCIIKGIVTPEEIGSTWEELDRLLGLGAYIVEHPQDS
jgi:hypothetical protein